MSVERYTYILPVSGTLRGPGPEVLLPSWMAPKVDNDTLLSKLFDGVSEYGALIERETVRISREWWLSDIPLHSERMIWMCSNPMNSRDVSIVVQPYSISPKITRSEFEFYTTLEPVALVHENKILFRNLTICTSGYASTTGVYTITDSQEIEPDYSIFWIRSGEPIPQEVEADSPYRDGKTISLPVTGTTQFKYYSKDKFTQLLSGTAVITSTRGVSTSQELTLLEPNNAFDGYGYLTGLPRLHLEDNAAYKERLFVWMLSGQLSSMEGVARSVGTKLGLSKLVRWDGVSTLSVDSTQASGYTYVLIPEIEKYLRFREHLYTSGGVNYYARNGNWLPGWVIYNDGRPTKDLTVVGNKVTVTTPVTGQLTVDYGIERWNVTRGSSGYITAINCITGVASGIYNVVLTRHIRVFNVGNPEYISGVLLDATGLPTRLFYEITAILLRESKISFGYSSWGKAYWKSDNELGAEPSYLVTPMDVGVQ